VRLILPACVKPFVKRRKNDTADATAKRSHGVMSARPTGAICEAALTVLVATLQAPDTEITRRAKANPVARRRMAAPGVGEAAS